MYNRQEHLDHLVKRERTVVDLYDSIWQGFAVLENPLGYPIMAVLFFPLMTVELALAFYFMGLHTEIEGLQTGQISE